VRSAPPSSSLAPVSVSSAFYDFFFAGFCFCFPTFLITRKMSLNQGLRCGDTDEIRPLMSVHIYTAFHSKI
jgi:hypothetical protein